MPKKDYLLHFSIIPFVEGETHVAYCPELELKAYGLDEEEAQSGLKTAFRKLFKTHKEAYDLMAYFIKLGYELKISPELCELIPPDHEELLLENPLYKSLSKLPKQEQCIRFTL